MEMRNDKHKIKKLLIIFTVITILLSGGSIFISDFYLSNTVEAGNLEDSFVLNKEKNPINMAIKAELNFIEEKNADEELARKKKEVQNNLSIDDREKIFEKNGKVAYLTFDDGPSKIVTPQILDILNEYNIKATFFVLGSLAEKSPEILKRSFDEGHKIGNHTYSHIYNYIYKNPNNFLNDIERNNLVLKSILGEDFNSEIIRFPGGSFGENKVPFKQAVEESGYRHFDWNSLNGDAEGVNLSKNQLVNRFISTVKDQKRLIVLMHDVDAKATTVESLPTIIEYLIDNGYIFGILDENFEE